MPFNNGGSLADGITTSNPLYLISGNTLGPNRNNSRA